MTRNMIWFCGGERQFFLFIVIALLSFDYRSAFNVAPEAAHIASIPGRKNPNRSAYFGYSVGLLQSKDSLVLLVGAPRANSTDGRNNEPGTVFKCPLQIEKESPTCEEVILNPNLGNQHNSWTGASLDIDKDGNTIVCAPRWKSDTYTSKYLISGLCYILPENLRSSSSRLIDPMLNADRQTFTYLNAGVYYYAHGICGLDAHFTDNDLLLLGLPGVLNWQGSVAKYVKQNHLSVGGNRRQVNYKYTEKLIPNPVHTSRIQDSDYFGYTVTSGKFDRAYGYYIVAGAPRGAELYGMVLVFMMKLFPSQPLYIKELKQGSQLGEYFGAAVAAPNLNGDEFSDLVVGAPMHSDGNAFDAGCVYIYLTIDSGDQQLSNEAVKLMGDVKRGARFGTSLGTPGDLDKDGFEDLLVGAPYENENRGAVYVFMGSMNGIREQYSQKLIPEEASNTPLKGFGTSFSRSTDVDGNQYPDFAVGSFMSDDAALLLTRPVIKMNGEMKSNPPTLSLTDNHFILTSCLNILDGGAIPALDVNVQITISHESANGDILASFSDTGLTGDNFVFTAVPNRVSCRELKVNLKVGFGDPQNPVIVRMSFDLKDNHLKGPENPILSPYNKEPVNLVLNFITGCDQNICRSDLVFTSKVKDFFSSTQKLLIGEIPKLTIDVQVRNLNDLAFLPNVTLHIPKQLTVLPSMQDCTVSFGTRFTIVACQLQNPLGKKETDSVSIDLDVSKMDDTSPDIKIKIEANSATSIDLNPNDNEDVLVLGVEKKASIKVTGWSRPEQFTYKRLSASEVNPNETIEFKHVISMEKSDVTPLKEIVVNVYVPMSIINLEGDDIELFQDLNKELLFQSKNQICDVLHVEQTNRPNVQSKIKNKMDDEIETILNGDEEGYYVILPVCFLIIFHMRTLIKQRNKEIHPFGNLDCSSGSINCSVISCKVGPFPRSFGVAVLTVSYVMNLTSLDDILPIKDGFTLISYVEIFVAKHPLLETLKGQRFDNTLVQTFFYPEALASDYSLPWWVYLLTILGGILLLSAIALILYKVGFFKRKSMEDLKTQKATLLAQNEQAAQE